RRSRSSTGFGPEETISKNRAIISNPATAAPIIISSLISPVPFGQARQGPNFLTRRAVDDFLSDRSVRVLPEVRRLLFVWMWRAAARLQQIWAKTYLTHPRF